MSDPFMEKGDTSIRRRPAGMRIQQVIAMLMAAEAQGAQFVQIAVQKSPDHRESSGVDWVGMRPVEKTVYIATMDDWDYMSNEALDTLDM